MVLTIKYPNTTNNNPTIDAIIWPRAASIATLSPPEVNHLIPPIRRKINASITAMKNIEFIANLTMPFMSVVGILPGGAIFTVSAKVGIASNKNKERKINKVNKIFFTIY